MKNLIGKKWKELTEEERDQFIQNSEKDFQEIDRAVIKKINNNFYVTQVVIFNNYLNDDNTLCQSISGEYFVGKLIDVWNEKDKRYEKAYTENFEEKDDLYIDEEQKIYKSLDLTEEM